MAKKDEVEILTKKEKEQFKKEALKLLNENIKQELVDNVVKDVKCELDKIVKDVEETIDIDYKNELKESVSKEIIDDIKNNVKKEQARLLRSKTFKIIRLEIYILVLLAFSGLLIFKLYQCGELKLLDNLNINTNTNSNYNNNVDNNESTTTVTTTTLGKEYFINKYKYLIENFKVENVEIFKKSNNITDLSKEDKLSIVYYTLSNEDIIKEDLIYEIKGETLKNAYINLFGTEDYEPVSFSVNNLMYGYSKTNDTYLAINSKSKDVMLVKNDIYDYLEEDGILKLYSYVYINKDSKKYNINDLEKEVENNKDLTKIEYVFKNIDNKYYISSINVVE